MTDSSLLMPGVDEAYRRSRDRLRSAEIELRDRIEAVSYTHLAARDRTRTTAALRIRIEDRALGR